MEIVILGSGQIGSHLSTETRRELTHIRLLPLRNLIFKSVEVIESLNSASHMIWAGKDVATISKPGEAGLASFTSFVEYLRFRDKPLHLIYFSSGGAIYGDTRHYPTSERQELHPISTYGIGKMKHEQILRALSDRNLAIKLLIMRVSNVYSFNNLDLGLISSIDRAIRNDLEISVFGGKQTRDYISIRDLKVVTQNFWENEVEGVINVGTGSSYSVDEIIEIFEATYSKKLKVVRSSLGSQEVLRSELDVSKMQSLGPFFFRKFPEILQEHMQNMSRLI